MWAYPENFVKIGLMVVSLDELCRSGRRARDGITRINRVKKKAAISQPKYTIKDWLTSGQQRVKVCLDSEGEKLIKEPGNH